MILIKADNNSEWDQTSHFLFNINEKEIQKIEELQNKLKLFEEIVSLIYYNNIDGEFVYIEEDDYPEYFEEEIINIDKFEDFTNCEERPQFSHTLINKNYISFIGYGKNTSTEFYTYEIDLKELCK